MRGHLGILGYGGKVGVEKLRSWGGECDCVDKCLGIGGVFGDA